MALGDFRGGEKRRSGRRERGVEGGRVEGRGKKDEEEEAKRNTKGRGEEKQKKRKVKMGK